MKAHQEGEIRNFSCKPISHELREEVNEAAAVRLPRHYRVIKNWREYILGGGLERWLDGDKYSIPYTRVTNTECGFSGAPGLKNISINGCGTQMVSATCPQCEASFMYHPGVWDGIPSDVMIE